MIRYRNIDTLVNLGNDAVRFRCAIILNLLDFVTRKRSKQGSIWLIVTKQGGSYRFVGLAVAQRDTLPASANHNARRPGEAFRVPGVRPS